MADSVFDIFGDSLTRHGVKNIGRQPLSNNENLGKVVGKTNLSGPIKPNEPIKKIGETKKSFLANTGKALQTQSTPIRKVFTPRPVNVGAMIYTDEITDLGYKFEDIEFTKPSSKYDNFNKDMFDYLPLPESDIVKQLSPPNTPPPPIRKFSMELDYSDYDISFADDFSIGSIPEEDLGLPDLY